jgi:ribonuclease Z
MIRRGSDTLLFDCGEGTQQQMMRARTGFVVDAIFITHWHADHFLGMLGLVQTFSFLGRTEPLDVYGPPWVQECVQILKQAARYNVRFPIRAHELGEGSTVRFEGYTVIAFGTDHGLPALGYLLTEDPRPGRFDRERAVALGVRPGPLFGKLQRGETVEVHSDAGLIEVHPGDVMGPPRPGRTLVYTGDTRPVPCSVPPIAEGIDLLIHDATYDDAEAARAREVSHSTAGEAGDVAAAIGARTLALVHISSRYTTTATHIKDAEKRFSGTIIAPSDLDILEIQYRD